MDGYQPNSSLSRGRKPPSGIMLRTTLLSAITLIGCNSIKTETENNAKPGQTTQIESKNLPKEELQSIKETTMQDFLNSTIGTTAVLVLVYVAGGVTFSPVWNWVKSKVPFLNK